VTDARNGSNPASNYERLVKLEAENAALVERVAKLEAVIGSLAAVFTGVGAREATDRELDHPRIGDPEVKVSPRDWSGEPMKGRRMSRCSAEFLDLLAETFDYFEGRNRETGAKASNGKPKADYDKLNARLARGWARRLRRGWTPPEKPASTAMPTGGFGSSGGMGSGRGFGVAGTFGRTPPAPPSPPLDITPSTEDESDADLDFPYGANAKPGPASTSAADEDDDDPPLALGAS